MTYGETPLQRWSRKLGIIHELLLRMALLTHALVFSLLMLGWSRWMEGSPAVITRLSGVAGVIVALAPLVLRWRRQRAFRAWLGVVIGQVGVILLLATAWG